MITTNFGEAVVITGLPAVRNQPQRDGKNVSNASADQDKGSKRDESGSPCVCRTCRFCLNPQERELCGHPYGTGCDVCTNINEMEKEAKQVITATEARHKEQLAKLEEEHATSLTKLEAEHQEQVSLKKMVAM